MELIQAGDIAAPPDLKIRALVIEGLAMAVPDFLTRAEAADQMRVWFPEDQLAVTALHRQISNNQQPLAA